VSYAVEIEKSFSAVQGLTSPVRGASGLPPLAGPDGFQVTLHVGVTFADDQLTERGWFVDTDAVAGLIDETCNYLSSDSWTSLFGFRPTFELVAHAIFLRLRERIAQVSYVELHNRTIGVRTRYQPSPGPAAAQAAAGAVYGAATSATAGTAGQR
jgi:6-pyruvoyltetrahydropterin/6-carboxytetrahydropterin synthase